MIIIMVSIIIIISIVIIIMIVLIKIKLTRSWSLGVASFSYPPITVGFPSKTAMPDHDDYDDDDNHDEDHYHHFQIASHDSGCHSRK